MDTNIISSSSALNQNRIAARQLPPIVSQQSVHPAFQKDMQGSGKISSPFQANALTSAINQSDLRGSILSSITQSRVTAAQVFNAAPAGAVREKFNIQNHYHIPPEDVKPILDRLQEEIRNTNLSVMSKQQAYEWIENKFIEAFGNDFMIGFNLLQVIPGFDMSNNPNRAMSNYEYVDIGHIFNDLVSNSIGFGEMQKINRERLYGNKSDMEVVDAIIAKHPMRLTNRCLAMITVEMHSVGITDDIGFSKYVDLLFEKSGDSAMSQWTDFEDVWNSLLNKPANVQEMAFLHNGALRDNPKDPFVLRVRDILVKLGAELGPNGFFLNPNGDPFVELDVTFGSLDSDDLLDEFRDDLEQHDENLRESKELYEKSANSKEVSNLYETASNNYHNSLTSTSEYIL